MSDWLEQGDIEQYPNDFARKLFQKKFKSHISNIINQIDDTIVSMLDDIGMKFWGRGLLFKKYDIERVKNNIYDIDNVLLEIINDGEILGTNSHFHAKKPIVYKYVCSSWIVRNGGYGTKEQFTVHLSVDFQDQITARKIINSGIINDERFSLGAGDDELLITSITPDKIKQLLRNMYLKGPCKVYRNCPE